MAGRTRKQLDEHFIRSANSAANWRTSAATLMGSADLIATAFLKALDASRSGETGPELRRDLSGARTFLLLAGLAVENLVKGLLVERKLVKGSDRARLPGKLGGHPIVERLKSLQVDLSVRERQLVRRLEEAVLWLGRYLVPRNAKSLRFTAMVISNLDVRGIRQLYDRLDALFIAGSTGA